ncbi:MAG: 2-hydroxyacyl-CoA dehydratase family protein [Deltaproteobacteria bacterium]|jgi:benzoyl-CoA reductase/2-hydroxyglutaryl-CoA dehydratase subunit BcrC/BadD/HgdB|nr:2-hydroxyacyl-CoA dehydratase family protein [Deltaproteobacteria bacterium]
MATKKIGFTCAYAPVPIIEAAGFTPFRVFPETDSKDQSGYMLHDNLCPHVKKVLDRALDEDLPELEGMVFINSCDSMRRLSDAWQEARPGDRTILLDLPSSNTDASITFLAGEYKRLLKTLCQWNSVDVSLDKLKSRINAWNSLSQTLGNIEHAMGKNFYPGLFSQYQKIINLSAMHGVDKAFLKAKEIDPDKMSPQKGHAPVFIFGNLLFDPKVFNLFEEWNMHVADNDFCTGSRFVNSVDYDASKDLFYSLASSWMNRTPCARTMDIADPGAIARKIVDRAKSCNARGVIGFTVKFCDPYLARIPMIREALQQESIPFLMIEGDCTLGSMGQQQTRIEAFTEMLEV